MMLSERPNKTWHGTRVWAYLRCGDYKDAGDRIIQRRPAIVMAVTEYGNAVCKLDPPPKNGRAARTLDPRKLEIITDDT